MKIMLLTAPVSPRSVYGYLSVAAPVLPPLGLCYLGAVLRKAGHQIRIIDASARLMTPEEIVALARRDSPRMIGISSTTCGYSRAKELLSLLRERLPAIFLVLGGAHVSARPRATMEECPELDLAVIGEGEETAVEVAARLDSGEGMEGVRGIVYRRSGLLFETPPRRPLSDLDRLPLPARDLLNDLSVYRPTPLRGRGKSTSMVTSRGCPFNCSYCSQAVFGSRWRAVSPERMVEEIKELIRREEVEFISFEDDNFLFRRDRTELLCDLLCRDNIKIQWGCAVRAENIDSEITRKMKAAGCRYIYLGVESGSRRIRELLGRKQDLARIEKAVLAIKGAGIYAYGAFMMGIPTETSAELKQTRRAALNLGLDGIFLFQYTPYPGTRLRELACREGEVSSNWEDYSAHHPTAAFRSNYLSPAEVKRYIMGTYLKFFLRPRMFPRLVGLVWKILSRRYG